MFHIPSSHIFNAKDATELEASGLLTPADEKGVRKIHKRRMTDWSNIEHFHLSVDVSPETEHEAFVSVPDQIISKNTIAVVGFTDDKTEEIWYQWANRPVVDWAHRMEQVFLDYILEYVQYPKSVYDEEVDTVWTEAMDGWGISVELQEAIMDPIFRAQRLDFTCNEVVKDSIIMRYEGLWSVSGVSHDRAAGKTRPLPDFAVGDDGEVSFTEWIEQQGIILEDL